MSQLIIFSLASILTLSGCFKSPSNGGKDKDQALNILWEYAYDPDGGAPRARPLIHGTTVITSGDINVTSLDYRTGELVWKTPFENTRQLLNRSFGLNEYVLSGTIVNKMMAWDVRTGQQLWEIPFADSLNLTDRAGVGEIPAGFIAFSSGNRIFRIHLDGDFDTISTDARSYFAKYHEGNLIVCQVKDMKGVISAFDMETMDLLWRFEPGSFGYPAYAPPIIENGIVYVGTVGGPGDPQNGFFALNAATGQEIWRKEGIFTYASILVDDRIYGVNGNNVWALNKSNGQMVWSTNSQGGGHGEGTLAWLDGHVYWSHSSGLHVFKGDTGELVHVEPAPDRTYFWLVTADKGRIFAQTSRHLYAFAPWGHEEALE